MGRDILVRLGGLAIVLTGFACLYFFLLMPLQEAQAGVAEVRYELKAFALVPLCFVFGAVFLVFGDGFDYRTDDGQNLTAKGWIAFAAVVVLTGLGFWWFHTQFAALGYV